jgi:hypothetical protein
MAAGGASVAEPSSRGVGTTCDFDTLMEGWAEGRGKGGKLRAVPVVWSTRPPIGGPEQNGPEGRKRMGGDAYERNYPTALSRQVGGQWGEGLGVGAQGVRLDTPPSVDLERLAKLGASRAGGRHHRSTQAGSRSTLGLDALARAASTEVGCEPGHAGGTQKQ